MRLIPTAAMAAAMLCLGSGLALAPLQAQTAPVQPAPAPEPARPPQLIVTISIDQLSSDLLTEYRGEFAGGFARLLGGTAFPFGYQAMAATETCPGHSTILTGSHPARSGIIANDWINPALGRDDKTIYCVEDESVPGTSSRNYTVSTVHLRVPTLGDRMKAANPATRVVSVSQKDRAAVMLGGRNADETWWWGGEAFRSYAGRAMPAAVARANAAIARNIGIAQPGLAPPAFCQARSRAIPIGPNASVGTGNFAREAGDRTRWRASPESDGATLALGAALMQDLQLGRRGVTDLLAISLSATDYVGHTFGTRGSEMCLHLMSLDRDLGAFIDLLDASGVDYQIVLTSDHGGLDLPERDRQQGAPHAARVDRAVSAAGIGAGIASELGLTGQLLFGGNFGDVWFAPTLSTEQRARVGALAVARYRAMPQVHSVFTRAEILATPMPSGAPDTWSLLERVRASFDPERSGDLYVVLKPRITPIPDPSRGYVATHGSVWDYDRRVPILFLRKGVTGVEQPAAVATVDIMPTLASLIGLAVPAGEIDGRCLDLDPGPGSNCR